MITLFYQIAIFILIFVGIFVITKIMGNFIHEDWFYSKTLSKAILEKRSFDILMKFNFSSSFELDEVVKIPILISGNDLISKEFSLDAELMAKQTRGNAKEGKLEFYFTRPIEIENPIEYKNPPNGIEKTYINKIYAKFRAVAYGLKQYTSYRWDSESLLPFSFYETCLTFKGIRKNMIFDIPTISIEVEHKLESFDTIKFLFNVNNMKSFPEKYTSSIKLFVNKSTFTLKSRECPKIGQDNLGFLLKIPNTLKNSDFIEFNLVLINEDNLLKDLELKAITGICGMPPRGFFIKYQCNYCIKINIQSGLIKNILKKELLFGINNIEANVIASTMARIFATNNKIETQKAIIYLRQYFISIQELCPNFLRESIFKIIDGFKTLERETPYDNMTINDELMQTFIINDAFDKAHTLLMEQSHLESKK